MTQIGILGIAGLAIIVVAMVLSRSLIRYLTVMPASSRSMIRFRAAWVVHSAVGWADGVRGAGPSLDAVRS